MAAIIKTPVMFRPLKRTDLAAFRADAVRWCSEHDFGEWVEAMTNELFHPVWRACVALEYWKKLDDASMAFITREQECIDVEPTVGEWVEELWREYDRGYGGVNR